MKVEESGIIEIYTNNKDSFSVGRVYCQNDGCAVFEDIDVQGRITGYCAIRKDIISQCNSHTEYLDKLDKYMEYWQQHPYSGAFSLKQVALDIEKPLIIQVLDYAKGNNLVITMGMAGKQEPETGYVRETAPDGIIFSCLDVSNAKIYDEITVAMDDIIVIEFESIDNLLLGYAHTIGG